MRSYRYRLLNVFAETIFGGNPLCVFEDARGLDDAEMQALALQFNLSETTFILPSQTATRRVRIYTPGYEMPFAGHPTLGTAQVVRAMTGVGDSLSLEMQAGVVAVTALADTWTLSAPSPRPATRRPLCRDAQIAAQLGVRVEDMLSEPLWVDTGADQLLVPLRTAAAVQQARPDAALLDTWEASKAGRRVAYLFAFDGHNADGVARVVARYFFVKPAGGVVEDPGTGSACANLGGWYIATGRSLPARVRVEQGVQAGRPCVLGLELTDAGAIRVSGQVLELGSGVVNLP
jgi:PhzF family phenazine biosynthesis protein